MPSPSACNFTLGLVSPIPKFPELVITAFWVKEPPLVLKTIPPTLVPYSSKFISPRVVPPWL